MSDAEGGQTPAEAGRDLEDPDTMNATQQAETGAQAPAEAITDFGSLYARQQTRFIWSVLNTASDDGVSVHSVDTRALECTCEDHTFNRESGEGDVCKHVAVALFQADGKISPEIDSMWTLTTMLSDAREAKSEIESIRDLYRTLKNSEAQAAAEGATEDDRPSLEETQPDTMQSPEDARATLEEAYEDADGLYMKDSGTDEYQGTPQVTFSIGGEDFDDVKAATSECDLVGYNGDANTLAVEDVEAYIAEVLE